MVGREGGRESRERLGGTEKERESLRGREGEGREGGRALRRKPQADGDSDPGLCP